ncbi:tRNA (N6-isopentenyl adenosine(37)-C2)-methylthiotransferase MiaB [Geobacter sp. AOG1]|uniref:tRNA (N6-isopentenyl adenosine(37)-C2)-methylthiotransferase MiaB n=1 Tax=Geobacter sp. AOG1 TaxID=1566346 RepID=UPI001CC4CC83|nr:tRNA (N6-isopentenyl adenosine(37)-C2)-methylthiotransferase MiaB [Geobacter sp. AOG1]
MKQGKLVYVETFGCQMNVSDSEKIVTLLKGLGYNPTTESSQADLIILNTCSVRAKAEQKVYNILNNYKGLKRQNRRLILGVGGCVAQQEGERLLAKVPHLDLVFGTHNLHQLPALVRGAEAGQRQAEVAFIDTETRLNLFPADETEGGVTRFVTVMQGCDNFCAYCIVPHVRGREISRRSTDILGEIAAMADRGVKEVTLLGQNVNSYGLKSQGELDFAGLLRRVAVIDGIERIRFTTSHPKDISPTLIACFAELPTLCSHIHLPAQAGSDGVLARMDRGYSRAEYLAKIAALRNARPDIHITGDMIVGFPGETDADFEQTLSLMEEVRYADLFSFLYSVRPGTKAAEFADEVPREVKQERLQRLQNLQRTMTLELNRSLVGSDQEVLVEGVSKRGDQLYGRSSGNRIVNFAGGENLIGSLVPVTITRAYQNSLLGELLHH